MPKFPALLAAVSLAGVVRAHIAAWHPAMWCLDGTSGTVNLNTNEIVNPLYQLPFSDWWMHHVNKCDEFPPADGVFLDLPAGGSFDVELSTNRATTSLSYDGQYMTDWIGGVSSPEEYEASPDGCIFNPNIHTQNETMAAGTAFAISYVSELSDVTPDNLAVFSVRYHTPWARVATYDVPAGMPPCPEEGCICAWGWIANGCGEPNMYMEPFRCRVTNPTSSTPIAPPQAPVWCEDDPSRCIQGSKQMLYWHQLEGNNIEVSGSDLSGMPRSPAYNAKCGFQDGAQNDIFTGAPTPINNDGDLAPAPSDTDEPQTAEPTPEQPLATVTTHTDEPTPVIPPVDNTPTPLRTDVPTTPDEDGDDDSEPVPGDDDGDEEGSDEGDEECDDGEGALEPPSTEPEQPNTDPEQPPSEPEQPSTQPEQPEQPQQPSEGEGDDDCDDGEGDGNDEVDLPQEPQEPPTEGEDGTGDECDDGGDEEESVDDDNQTPPPAQDGNESNSGSGDNGDYEDDDNDVPYFDELPEEEGDGNDGGDEDSPAQNDPPSEVPPVNNNGSGPSDSDPSNSSPSTSPNTPPAPASLTPYYCPARRNGMFNPARSLQNIDVISNIAARGAAGQIPSSIFSRHNHRRQGAHGLQW